MTVKQKLMERCTHTTATSGRVVEYLNISRFTSRLAMDSPKSEYRRSKLFQLLSTHTEHDHEINRRIAGK